MGATPQHTPLFDVHRALGAKLVEFGGWEMPVSYRGILDEHRAVREKVGLFDVSHMGEIELTGPRAAAACQALTTNDVRRLVDGQVQYTLLCRPDGGVVDDVTLYRVAAERYFFCVNAANIAKDLAWIRAHAGGATVTDCSAEIALLALQGPRAAALLGRLTPLRLGALRSFRFVEGPVAGVPTVVSRTGYTGEDGFELYVPAPRAVALWSALVEAGAADGLEPVGLGARDTLRLEAALPLYGNELDDTTTPLAAGLDRFVVLDGEDFLGREALLRERAGGIRRRLVGLELVEAGIARHGYAVRAGETTAVGERADLADSSPPLGNATKTPAMPIGVVTSGTRSPTLGRSIALAYVEAARAALGTELAVEIRGRPVAGRVVPTPFYRRARARARDGAHSG